MMYPRSGENHNVDPATLRGLENFPDGMESKNTRSERGITWFEKMALSRYIVTVGRSKKSSTASIESSVITSRAKTVRATRSTVDYASQVFIADMLLVGPAPVPQSLWIEKDLFLARLFSNSHILRD